MLHSSMCACNNPGTTNGCNNRILLKKKQKTIFRLKYLNKFQFQTVIHIWIWWKKVNTNQKKKKLFRQILTFRPNWKWINRPTDNLMNNYNNNNWNKLKIMQRIRNNQQTNQFRTNKPNEYFQNLKRWEMEIDRVKRTEFVNCIRNNL